MCRKDVLFKSSQTGSICLELPVCGDIGSEVLDIGMGMSESVTGQRSNRLVCRPSQRLRQRVFRISYVIHLILFGPYPGHESRSHRAARSRAETSTPSASVRPHPVQGRVLSIF
jgi:hypothetical protein